jgi:hypothetical protein
MSQFIPGKPQIQPKNLPGAGSMNAINSAYNVGPRDGTMMATFGPEVAFEPLRNGEGVKFDTLKFNWIGSMNRQVSIAVMTKASGIRDILDARTKTVSVGASGAGSQSSLNPFVYNAFLGTRFKVVTGYPGTKEITMAVERGELDGIAGWSWDSLKLERPGWASSPDVHASCRYPTDGIARFLMSRTCTTTSPLPTIEARWMSFSDTSFWGGPSWWRQGYHPSG